MKTKHTRARRIAALIITMLSLALPLFAVPADDRSSISIAEMIIKGDTTMTKDKEMAYNTAILKMGGKPPYKLTTAADTMDTTLAVSILKGEAKGALDMSKSTDPKVTDSMRSGAEAAHPAILHMVARLEGAAAPAASADEYAWATPIGLHDYYAMDPEVTDTMVIAGKAAAAVKAGEKIGNPGGYAAVLEGAAAISKEKAEKWTDEQWRQHLGSGNAEMLKNARERAASDSNAFAANAKMLRDHLVAGRKGRADAEFFSKGKAPVVVPTTTPTSTPAPAVTPTPAPTPAPAVTPRPTPPATFPSSGSSGTPTYKPAPKTTIIPPPPAPPAGPLPVGTK